MPVCPLGDHCHAPSCAVDGPKWRARATDRANVDAFKADVVAECKASGRRDVGHVAAKVFRRAMAAAEEGCMLS